MEIVKLTIFVSLYHKPYTMDFRGFGGTPHDSKSVVEPNRCVEDVESVLAWILARHDTSPERGRLSLMGWSQGGLVAQLAGQKSQPLFSKLILYGSIYDPMHPYPRQPLFSSTKDEVVDVKNTWDGAVEDFTIEGSIPPETASKFAEAALLSDPIKARWSQLHQFNNCDPSQIHVPTLVVSKCDILQYYVALYSSLTHSSLTRSSDLFIIPKIAGDQDPYAPLSIQQDLFSNLGRGSDRTLSILAEADHAVHLLDGRERFAEIIKSFLQNGKRKEQIWDY
jgi:pimeloyl-ACP methyl ester carboxylesterase